MNGLFWLNITPTGFGVCACVWCFLAFVRGVVPEVVARLRLINGLRSASGNPFKEPARIVYYIASRNDLKRRDLLRV